MLTPYLLSFALSLAAANPILQGIPIQIPGQYAAPSCPTCPTPSCATCPQACQTCPAQTCPQRTCQTCQNPQQSIPGPMVLQSSNTCPCNKATTVQNPIANLNQDTIQQLILRRLLGSQIQAPGTVKSCSQTETQKSTPNIINNYIIIPPEYFKANETKSDNEESNKRRKGERRKASRQRNKNIETACSCDNNDDVSNEKDTKNGHIPCQCDKGNSSKSSGDSRVQKAKSDMINGNNIPKSTIMQDNQKDNLENNPVSNKKYRGRSREETNRLEDAIIKDFCRKNPSIPKEIARGLLNNIKHRIESQKYSHISQYPYSPSSYSHYYNPHIYYYPQIDEHEEPHGDRFKSRGSRRRGNKRRSERRNKKPKDVSTEDTSSSDKNSENVVETNPSTVNIEKEIVTTEKITTTTTAENKMGNTAKVSETQMETPDDLFEQLDKMKAKFAKLNEIETTTVSFNKRIKQYPQLGEEDKIPTVYSNGVDDYYPDFRGDNIHFYESEEECFSKDKYHNKKEETDSKGNKINNNGNKADVREQSVAASTESYETYDKSIKDGTTEIRFRNPPHLELPDFETRQINKFSQEISEIDMKPAKVFTKDKSGRTNIETVFGHSKVIKYGQDEDAAGNEPVITYYLPEEAMTEDRIELPDGGTVVVARSIRDIEGWI